MADLSFLDPNMNSTDETPMGAVSPDLSFLDPDQGVKPSDHSALINARELTHGMDPQRTAKVIDLSRKAGLPPRIVEERMDEIERREMLNDGLLADVASKAPKTTSFLSDPDRFAVAQTDIENLAELERLIATGPVDSFAMSGQMPSGDNRLAKELIADPITAIGKGLAKAPGSLAEMGLNFFAIFPGAIDSAAQGVEQLTGLPRGGYFGELRDAALGASKWIRENYLDAEPLQISEDLRGKGAWDNPEIMLDPEWVAYVTTDILPSIGATILAYRAGGPAAAGLVGGGIEGGSLQAELLEEGMEDWKANTAGQVFGILSGTLNAIGADKVLGQGVATSWAKRLIKGFFVKGAVEGATEWAEEPVQALVAGIARGDSAPTIAADIVEATQKGFDVFLPALITGGLAGTATERVEYQKAQFAAKEQEVLDALTQNIAQSNLAQLDPVLYQEALTVLKEGGAVSDIHIPASAIMSSFGEDLAGMSDVLNQLGVSFESFDLALSSGDTVAVPIDQYGAAIVANPDLAARFANDRKLSADGYTRNELAAFNQEWATETQRILRLAAETEEEKNLEDAESKAIFEQVYTARQQAGRVPDAARLDAAQFTAALVSMAKMSEGKYTATELFQSYMPQVTAGQAAVDQQALQQDAAYAGVENQGEIEEAGRLWAEMGVESPYFKRWFGDSKAVDYSGKPLVVYHGTEARMGRDFAFEVGRKSKRYTTFSERDVETQGMFFSPSQEDAESYGGTVGAFYLSAKNPLMNPNDLPLSSKSSQTEKDAASKAWEDLFYIMEPVVYEADGGRYIDFNGGISRTPFDENGDWVDKVFADSQMEWDHLDNPEVVRRMKERGYDSVRVFEQNDSSGMSWFVTDPAQIKSATGNRGTFDPADPRIMYQSLSTRLPSAVKATEDPLNEVLTLDFNVALSDTKTLEKNMQALLATPNMRKPKGKGAKTPAKQAEMFIDHVVSNLLFLHDAMDPDMRARAKLWYDGGRKTIETWAERYGISEMQGAALIAVLSPQNGWFPNVSQAERIADIVFGLRDFRWDDAMTAEADRIAEGDAAMAEAKGKTLEELLNRPDVAARWIRVYDQTHNSRAYRVLTPEGGAADFAKTNSGAEATNAWKSYSTIAKGVSILLDGRAENVYYQIGREHKVRNFYNNLFDPTSPLGFTTIDTHAVAAAMLRPLAAADTEVLQAFGGTGSASSNVTGMNGTYPIYLEAYKRAAAARGLLPREMQSITWEAVRGLFEASKKKGLKDSANAIWGRYKAGEIEQEQAQQEIFALAGGVTAPSWSSVPYTDEVRRTYTGPAQDRIDSREPVGKSESDGFRVFFEVAPDPNDAALTAEWNALPQDAKQAVSQQVAQAMVPKVLTEIGASGSMDLQLGGYMGATNPSMALVLDRPELLTSAAKLLGYALAQDSMMVVSDRQSVGTQPVGAVTIDLPEGYGAKEVEALYDKLWELDHEGEKLVGGHTTANGHMVILNFSALDTKGLADVIYEHLGGEFTVRDSEIFSAFIDKEAYQYGRETDQRRDATGRTPIQGRADNLRNEATRLLREALDARGSQTLYQLPGRPGGAGLQGLRAGSLQIDQRYGTATDGASSVLGVHYSREPRTGLSGKFYGTGIRGAEARRLYLSSDERIKSRIHFYVDTGEGIVPEPGVGANIHAVHLDNLYNTDEDPKGLLAGLLDKGLRGPELMNTLESAILDAGFDGIYVPRAQATKGVAVLLGDHTEVPVQAVEQTLFQGGIVKEKEVVYEKADRGEDSVSARGGEGVYSKERGMRPIPGARLVELRATEKRNVPATISGPGQAAAAAAFLSDAPQEQLSALVLDAKGKPLAILSHSLGNIDSTQVDNRALLGAIQDVEGAKSFYLVHNHPAETAVLSSADRGLSENIRAINEGSGLSYGGIIAVTPSGYGDEFGNNQPYPPPGKQKKVPVVQRLFVKADRVQGLGPVSSPDDIKDNISTITGGAESGIILLSNNNVPLGFLPLDPAEMSRLRGDRLGEVLKSFHRTNATGIVGILPNEDALSAWRNVAAMANAINARPLDALYRNDAGSLDSARMQGKDVDSYGSKTFLQNQGDPQASFTFKTKSGRPLIELFRTANQSSFLHETGHLYLEMVRELALAPDAPAPVTALWTQTKAALKIDDGPITREAHEEWARNLEAYFLEGAAPSLGLRKIFAQYAQWLRSIYKQVEQIFLQSGTQINEDLKPIFDRIFASEKDIEEARSFYSSQKPFFSAADPKVMAKERERYEERRLRARESMEDKRLRQLTEAWVKASGGKAKIRAEVAEEVKARAVVAVIKAASGGMNMAALDASVGEDLRKQLKAIGRYSSLVKKEGAVDPDILAAENGYDSAVAMVEDLISFPGEKAAITAGVEARMEAERQRISRGLADTDLAADEAYHNDDQLAVLVAEFEILSQQAAQKTKRLEASMVRDVAKQLLASEKVDFASQSSRFARLERRAAKLARSAYERGDAKKAADYKRQEVLNHAMFIESVKLKEGIKKTAARIKRGVMKTKGISPEVKTLLQGLGIQYGILPYRKERDPVRAFEMWNQDLVAKGGKIPTIEGWVEEMRKLGISAPLDPFLNNAAAVPYQQITVGQFRALEEGVRILRRVDRGLHTVTWIDGSTITMEDAIERLKAHVAGRGGKAPDPLTYDPNAVAQAARNFFAEHTKTGTIIQALDNWEAGGLFYQLIYRPVMDADSDLSARWATEAPKIKALFEPIRRQLRKKVVVLGKARPRAQLVAAALNVGNAGNRERLMSGLGINETQLDQLLAPLTTEEMDFVQAVWDYIATFKEEAFAVERRLTGREPAAVEPVPFEFKGKTYAGGYYPVNYDKNLRDQKGEARDAKEALDELFGGTPAGTAMTAHGHLEARASAGTGERLSQELSVISDHVTQVLRDITHREAVVNVAKLLKNKQIMAMITDVVGREKAKQLWPWLVSVSKEGREQIQLTAVEKMLLHFRPAMTFYTQAYKVGTALMQAGGFFQVFEFVQAKHVGQAVWQLYGKGLLSLNMFSDGEIISHPLIKEIREKSPQMNERLLNADRDIRDATKEFSTSESALTSYKKYGFKATVAMQFYVADVVAWQGAYLQALSEGKTEKDAVNAADFVVEQSMGAGYTRALSKIQRGGSIQRFLTMFYTFGNVLYNLAARRAGITKRQLSSGQYGAAALGASSFLALQWVMPVLFESLVRGDVADDDDDETLAEKLLVNLLTYPAQSVLIARELSGIAKGFKYRFSPALKPFESVGQWISSVARAIEQEDASIAAKPTAQLVGTTTGLIPAQFINSGEVLTDYLTGEDPELSVKELLYGKGGRK